MELLQRIYMFFFNPIWNRTKKLDEQIRVCIAMAIMSIIYGLLLIWYSINMFDVYISLTIRMILAVILLIPFIAFINNKALRPVKWNKLISYSWIICGIIILLMGFVAKQNFGYWLIGPVIAFGFPCLYFIMGDSAKDINRMFLVVSKAIVLASIIYFICSMFAEFISDNVWDSGGRYNGTTSDANRIGEICVASLVAGIYLIKTMQSKLWSIMAVACMAFCICDTVLSVSRSTILAVGCMLIFYFIIEIREGLSCRSGKTVLKKIVLILLAFVLAAGISASIKGIHNMQIQKEVSVSGNNVEATQQQETVPVVDDSKTQIESRMNNENIDLNTFSSGRIGIWTTYISNADIIGHPADGKTPIADNLNNVAAHNTVLEMAYRSGWIAGILFFIVETISGIYVLRVLFRKNEKNSDCDYFTAFASIGFIIVSNLQVAYNPLTSIIFFVYAIAIGNLFIPKKLV